MNGVTLLLQESLAGNRQSAARLLPIVYQELRQLANNYINKEASGFTISATALVHEAFLRLVKKGDGEHWDNRGHFFAAAAVSMRRILVEIARKKSTEKRGGSLNRVTIALESVSDLGGSISGEKLLQLDASLNGLARHHEGAAMLVNMRFFAGMTMEESAAALGISKRTAQRNWAFAKAWLHQEMQQQ